MELSNIPDPPKILRYLSINSDDGNLSIVTGEYNLNTTYDLLRSYSETATMLFDPLVEYSLETGEIVPALATQWVVTNNSKKWIFTLRDDIWFHDGSKFNASAVKFTYDRLIDPANPAYVAEPINLYSNIPLESVEILNEYKISINFNNSYSNFVEGLATYFPIYSPNSFEGTPNITVPVGTGPYYLDLANSNKTFQRLLRNNQHFRGIPPFEEIHYIPYAFWEDLKSDLEGEKGDFTPYNAHWGGSWDYIDDYWEYFEGESRVEFGIINLLRPELANPLVRFAINYAINREEYIDLTIFDSIIKGVQPMDSIYHYENPFYLESVQGYPYNPLLANLLLDRAGYFRGSDGYRFNISINSFPWLTHTRAKVSSYLDTIGIQCNLPGIYHNNSLEDLYNRDFDIYIIAWSAKELYLMNNLQSTSNENFGHYSNFLMDYYLEKGLTTPINQEREYYYHNVQQTAQEDPPYLLLHAGKSVFMRAKHVGPYIWGNINGRIVFNYSNGIQENDIYYMKDVHVSEDPIYFPFTDGVVSLDEEQFEGNMTMTHQLNNFFPSQEELGKFYEVQVNNSELEYELKCYYDLDEINFNKPRKVQDIFQWNYSSQSWDKLEIINSNTKLRFSEVRLKGNVILRLGVIDLIILTYRYLPIVLLIITPIISVSSYVILKNKKMMKKIKEEFEVQ